MNYFQDRIKCDADKVCSKCGEPRVRAWDEMKDDEREFVHRMFRPEEARRRTHKWCVLCWEEVGDDAPRLA